MPCYRIVSGRELLAARIQAMHPPWLGQDRALAYGRMRFGSDGSAVVRRRQWSVAVLQQRAAAATDLQ